MSHWWRAYDHSVDNAKLQRLPGDLFKSWYNLCCLASANKGTLPSMVDLAFKLRVSEAKARNVIETLRQLRLVDDEGGAFRMHEWDEYQYKSDVSTERVKLFRKRRRNVSSEVSETPNETEENRSVKRDGSVSVSSYSPTSLELEESQKEQACGRKRKNKTPLPPDFVPDRDHPRKLGYSETQIDQQFEYFCDGARAHNRAYADWQAAWRNWWKSPYLTVNGNAKNGDGRLMDALKRNADLLNRGIDPLGESAVGLLPNGRSE